MIFGVRKREDGVGCGGVIHEARNVGVRIVAAFVQRVGGPVAFPTRLIAREPGESAGNGFAILLRAQRLKG